MKAFCFYGSKNKNATSSTLSRILTENDTLSHEDEDGQIKITILSHIVAPGNVADEDSDGEDGSGTINNLPGSIPLTCQVRSGKEHNHGR